MDHVDWRIGRRIFLIGVENLEAVFEDMLWPLGVLDKITVAHLPKIRVF